MGNNDKIIQQELVFVLTHPSVDVYLFLVEKVFEKKPKKNSREINRKYYSNQIAEVTTFPGSVF